MGFKPKNKKQRVNFKVSRNSGRGISIVAGFTLIEVLLSVSAIGIIGAIGIPVFLTFQNRNSLDIAAATLAETTRRAGVLARASDGDTNWGVYVEAGNLILFKGINYAGRDSSYDENFELPLSISISGTQEYIFGKFTGYPSVAGSTTFTLNNNETRTISINAKGTAIY